MLPLSYVLSPLTTLRQSLLSSHIGLVLTLLPRKAFSVQSSCLSLLRSYIKYEFLMGILAVCSELRQPVCEGLLLAYR